MSGHRNITATLLAFGVCNGLMGAGLLLTRDQLSLPLLRWLASLPHDHLSLLVGLAARGQIVLGLLMLVAGFVLLRRGVRRNGEQVIEP